MTKEPSFLIGPRGITYLINNVPYTISQEDPRYTSVLQAIKAKDWTEVLTILNPAKALTKLKFKSGNISVDEQETVTYNNTTISGTVVDRLLVAINNQLDCEPLVKFIERVSSNPNKQAIEQVYLWVEANGITLTPDGCIVAYKRVRDDYKSFYDEKTLHKVGMTVAIPRESCDNRRDQTCSAGLHFCSYSYLSEYHSGQGRVVVVKIDPKHVTSIPSDYNNAKGRCCQYEVIGELEQSLAKVAEKVDVIGNSTKDQNVISCANQINIDIPAYYDGYKIGYKNGRNKTAYQPKDQLQTWQAGFKQGYEDGTKHKPNLAYRHDKAELATLLATVNKIRAQYNQTELATTNCYVMSEFAGPAKMKDEYLFDLANLLIVPDRQWFTPTTKVSDMLGKFKIKST